LVFFEELSRASLVQEQRIHPLDVINIHLGSLEENKKGI